MNFKKVISALCAGAMALTMCAVSVSAATVEIDSENPGAWASSGKGITKAELEAVGGDVRIVLTVETLNPYGLADQFLVNPIDYDNGWISQTDYCTSDTIVAKTDGWICVQEGATTLEFVLSADAIPALGDDGLCFSQQNVLVKSAEYELGDAQGEIVRVSDKEGKAYCFGEYDPFASEDEAAEEEVVEETAEEEVVEETAEEVVVEEAAEEVVVEEVAAEEAVEETTVAAVATTTAAQTGNVSVVAIAGVMALAAGAAFATRKTK